MDRCLLVLLVAAALLPSSSFAGDDQGLSPPPPSVSPSDRNSSGPGDGARPLSPGKLPAPLAGKTNSTFPQPSLGSPAHSPPPPSPPPPQLHQPPPPPDLSSPDRPPPAGGSGTENKPVPNAPKGDGQGDNSGSPVDEGVEKCPGNTLQCPQNVIVCFLPPQDDTKSLAILIKNQGNVSVLIVVTPHDGHNPFFFAKNETKKIPFPSGTSQSSVTLKVGEKDCPLVSRSPLSIDIFFQQLHAYATPVYGAYAIIVTALVAGGTWACCKCRRRSRARDSGIPYQQLEMGVQESTSSVDANGGNGWNEGWDDEWEEEDEEAGRRSKDIQHTSVATNDTPVPLPKPSVRDEWEDWDD